MIIRKPRKEIVKCKNCGRPFFRMVGKASRGRVASGTRRRDSVNCSKECSREWARNKCRRDKEKKKK